MFLSDSILTAPISRWVLYIGGPLAFIALTSFFIFLRFPYDAVMENVSVQVEEAMNVELRVDDVELEFGFLIPGFAFENVYTRLADGTEYDLDYLFVRPAWSLSWFSANPSLFLEVDSAVGSFFGTITIGSEKRWDGSVRDVDLDALPFLKPSDGSIALSGLLSAEGDLNLAEEGLTGDLTFEVKDGSVKLDSLPMGLPYDSLGGSLTLGGEHRVEIESLNLEGPMLTAEISGTVGQADDIEQAELDLAMKFSEVQKNLIPMVKAFGISVGTDGAADMKIKGTWSSPKIQ